jgi:hypothetical protein
VKHPILKSISALYSISGTKWTDTWQFSFIINIRFAKNISSNIWTKELSFLVPSWLDPAQDIDGNLILVGPLYYNGESGLD